jgi:hypothetical protein
MPRSQVASVANYDFGAPTAEAEVLRFQVRKGHGGNLPLTFENLDNADGEVTVQVSEDGASWADVGNAALVNAAVASKHEVNEVLNLRQGLDNYVRLQALGGVRMRMQVRHDASLQIRKI